VSTPTPAPTLPEHPGWDAPPGVLADYLETVGRYVDAVLTPQERRRRLNDIKTRIGWEPT
jgi:hypothetical protein